MKDGMLGQTVAITNVTSHNSQRFATDSCFFTPLAFILPGQATKLRGHRNRESCLLSRDGVQCRTFRCESSFHFEQCVECVCVLPCGIPHSLEVCAMCDKTLCVCAMPVPISNQSQQLSNPFPPLSHGKHAVKDLPG